MCIQLIPALTSDLLAKLSSAVHTYCFYGFAAVHIAMMAFRSNWCVVCFRFGWDLDRFCTLGGLVDSLRIDSSVGAHSFISLMTVLHSKLRKVCGFVFLITVWAQSTDFFTDQLAHLRDDTRFDILCFIHSSAIATLLPRATSRPNLFLVGVKTKDLGFEYPRETYKVIAWFKLWCTLSQNASK